MSDVLSRQRIAVEAQGDKVTLSIGNADIQLDYETALTLGQWLRYRGKEAKRNAGDISRHWSAIAELSDAEMNDKLGIRNAIP